MDSEKLHKMFEKSDVYYKFEDIPIEQQLHPDSFICGLMKLYKLLNKKNMDFSADHDIVYLASSYELPDDITQEDVDYLKRCGFHFDSTNFCICAFC